MNEQKIIDEYLSELGVNKSIVKYMKENTIFLNEYFEDILGKDFYLYNDEIHKKEVMKKLKIGSEKFKIFEDGSIWFSLSTNPKAKTSSSFTDDANFVLSSKNEKYDVVKTSNYISFEDGNIVKRVFQQKNQIKDNRVYYDGIILEEKIGADLKSKIIKNAQFSNSITPIPTDDLETKIANINSGQINFDKINYNNFLWHLVSNGKIKYQYLIENLNSEKTSVKEKLNLLKHNILSKSETKNQISILERAVEEYSPSVNDNIDGFMNYEFSMKGKEGKICTFTIEKITQHSKEIIHQVDFQNTPQFTQQMLQPYLINYAQKNPIIQSSIKPSNNGLFQYRIFSTTNNVITINNITEEYANYISTEIKKVKPFIYNKELSPIENDITTKK